MNAARVRVAREQILAFRRAVGALDARLPPGAESLRRAAWAGLQDSMPRAAVLSIHARVEGTEPSTWEDPSLAQLWGPRYSVYVVPAQDLAVFSLGRLPEAPGPRQRAEDMAARLHAILDGKTMTDREAGTIAGVNSNAFRYAAPTGTVRIRWEGARAPTLWTVPRPEVDPRDARLDLARRYLHVFGPTTAQSFADWAGILPGASIAAFDELHDELTPVSSPLGDRWILAIDEPTLRAAPAVAPAPARLLPSGDAYWLLWGRDRELLVPDRDRRAELWTPRVWPGALLVRGEVVGTWRRADANIDIQAWRRLEPAEHEAVVAEAASLPLPGVTGRLRVSWID